jgi:hypothetical protein
VNETNDGSRRAKLDGATAEVELLDGLFVGIRIPAGKSIVEHRNARPGLEEGVVVASLGIAGCRPLARASRGFAGRRRSHGGRRPAGSRDQ